MFTYGPRLSACAAGGLKPDQRATLRRFCPSCHPWGASRSQRSRTPATLPPTAAWGCQRHNRVRCQAEIPLVAPSEIVSHFSGSDPQSTLRIEGPTSIVRRSPRASDQPPFGQDQGSKPIPCLRHVGRQSATCLDRASQIVVFLTHVGRGMLQDSRWRLPAAPLAV